MALKCILRHGPKTAAETGSDNQPRYGPQTCDPGGPRLEDPKMATRRGPQTDRKSKKQRNTRPRGARKKTYTKSQDDEPRCQLVRAYFKAALGPLVQPSKERGLEVKTNICKSADTPER